MKEHKLYKFFIRYKPDMKSRLRKETVMAYSFKNIMSRLRKSFGEDLLFYAKNLETMEVLGV